MLGLGHMFFIWFCLKKRSEMKEKLTEKNLYEKLKHENEQNESKMKTTTK